jgi:hypothetical protein
MFKVGDKVVPISKSVLGSLDSSIAWRVANKKGQKYLFVIRIANDGDIICWYEDSAAGGDYFRPSDLIPYVEDIKIEKPQLVTLDYLIVLKNKGILKGSDEFYIARA